MAAKRKRSNFKVTAIAITEASQGGAASLMNDPLMLKSLKDGRALTPEQLTILGELGYTESDINKSLMDGKNTPTSSEENGEDDLNLKKGTDTDMSEQILKELEIVKQKLAVSEAKQAIAPYSFGDLEKDIAGAMASLDDDGSAVITKAFGFLVECAEYGVAEAKGAKESNPLVKELGALDEESGVSGEDAEAKPLGDAEQKQADFAKALEAEYVKLDGKGGAK